MEVDPHLRAGTGGSPIVTGGIKQAIERELTGNILPFWVERAPDPVHGGFHGSISNDLQVDNQVPRSAVLYGRILWTFALAFRKYRRPEYLATARRAFDYLQKYFWDIQYGGVYWSVDLEGRPLETRKHTYAQSFAIYGLAEYHAATGDPQALALARQIFELLEAHAHEPEYGGYIEGRARDWSRSADQRLSALEPVCDKSMNTLLHAMEAYTNLLRVWDEPRLRTRLAELIGIFLDRVLDPQTHHLRQFFFNDWTWGQAEPFSYGHDIECAWLLAESAETLGDADLLQRARAEGVRIARAVYAEALQPDGRVYYESPEAPHARDLHWWVHAEAMVGFYNAYQLSGEEQFAAAAVRVWNFIEGNFSDHKFGDWFKVLDPGGKPYPVPPKVGPWECPYHQSRACFEMISRIP